MKSTESINGNLIPLRSRRHQERDAVLRRDHRTAESNRRDYAESRQPFDEIKHRHALNEFGDVAEGRYYWKIEKGRG